MSKPSLLGELLLLGFLMLSGPCIAKDNLHIVGSSTVYPFSIIVADILTKKGLRTPLVKSTGSGGGFKLFCEGSGNNFADIVNSSRPMKQSEYELCRLNGVTNILEIKFGYDGIVLAAAQTVPAIKLSKKEIFLALAANIPAPDGSENIVPNPYTHWNQINPALPEKKILVLGPPPTSGTRDAFEELAMEGGCETFAWLRARKKKDKLLYHETCRHVRKDGAYIDAGENDTLIVRQLLDNTSYIGIFGFSYLLSNRDAIQGSPIDGVEPTQDTISSGEYPLSRPLFFYLKPQCTDAVQGTREYLQEFVREDTWGPTGSLAAGGLIVLPEKERNLYKTVVDQLLGSHLK